MPGRGRKLTVTITPSRPADGAGWYRSPVTFTTTGTDSRGNSVPCSAPQTYSGPDVSHLAIVGTCTDSTGKSQSATFDLRYDATAPTVTVDADRTADHNGWFNKAVTFSTHGTDAMSGVVGCALPVTYLAPDTAAGTQSGSCTDAAGNTGTGLAQFKYDSTAPSATATGARAPNANGWYNAPVGISFSGTDATSGGVRCDPATTYAGPDSAAATVSGSCTDAAGNTASGSTTLQYDSTAPVVTATLDRVPDSGSWYSQAVSVTFSGSDALSNGVTCDPAASYSGPDSASAAVTGTCTDAAGNTGSARKTFGYDETAPTVTATPARAPDAGSIYTSPVTFVAGTDATSSGVTCDAPITYSGPDSANATVSGSCTDAAGNKGTGSATFGYQQVTPAAAPDTSLLSTPNQLTNQSSAQFVFASSASAASFECSLDGATAIACTSPQTYGGLTDGQHTFSVAASDGAGHSDPTPATFSWTIDTVAPDTAFAATPPDPDNTAASFSITTDADATLQCSLDNAAFTACTSPLSIPLSSLPDGSHTFQARGIDGAGNVDQTPATFTWTTDTVPPAVTLAATPLAVDSSTTATFKWTSNESAAYSCRVDNAVFASCGTGTAGTKAITGLLQGTHTFNLRARDAAGNLSATTAFTWTVDTGPPDTTITPASKPANPTASTSAGFSFTATEPSTFKCKLDNEPTFTACTSPQSYSGLADGGHTFSVEAVDTVGNVDPTPATYTWLVDITKPTGSITTRRTARPSQATRSR